MTTYVVTVFVTVLVLLALFCMAVGAALALEFLNNVRRNR